MVPARFSVSICMTVALFAFFWVSLPRAEANHTGSPVDQRDERVTDAITAFTLTFPISAGEEDLYIPVRANRGIENGSNAHALGYHLETQAEGETRSGLSAGILLQSGAEKIGDEFKIAAGTTARFTLVVLVGATEENGGLYRMTLDELPFYVGDEKEARHFNPSELKYFKTNFESVNYTRPNNGI